MCGIKKQQLLRVCALAVLGTGRECNWFMRKERDGCPVALSLGETVAAYDTEEPDNSPLHAISEPRRFIDNNHARYLGPTTLRVPRWSRCCPASENDTGS